MESQAEKILTVMMDMVIDGIPVNGEYFEQPIEREAQRYLDSCSGIADAAVCAAAYELLAKKPSWSKTVWRGTLRAVVGQLPFVGTATAVFTSEFESLWRQIRFVALAATMYGHNPRDETTQCQILLCLLGDKFINPNEQENLGKGLKEGTLKFAITTITKRIAISQSTGLVMKGALGGLLVGVMPGAISSIYNVVVLGKRENQEGAAKNASDSVKRVKEHFKMEEQPTLTVAKTAFLCWMVPKATTQLIRVDQVAFGLFSQQLGEVSSTHGLTLWYLIEVVVLFTLLVLFAKSKRFMVKLMRQQQWLLATIVLYVRALLNFLAVSNTALSFAVAIQSMDIYQGHRALVGIYSLLSTLKRFSRLKPYLAMVQGSLLLWILYAMALWAGNYALVLGELFTTDISTKSKLIAGIRKVHDSLETTGGFTRNRVNDAVDVISTVALHVLVEEIRRSEIIITLLGPVTVVDGILFAAKSLGTFVIRPEQLLQWLDYASPPPVLAWGIFSAQLASNSLGAMWGLSSATGLLSTLERLLVVYGVLVTIPLAFMHRRLPPPYENRDWNMALNSRHRLLFLIPELDSGVRSKLHFVIKFFERYEKAYASTTNTWTSSVAWVDRKWASVHSWMQRNITQRLQVTNAEEAAEYQFVQESEVPYKEDIDEDNQNTHYSRIVRYLRKKQHTNMLEMDKEIELEKKLELKMESVSVEPQRSSPSASASPVEETAMEDVKESPRRASWTAWMFGATETSSMVVDCGEGGLEMPISTSTTVDHAPPPSSPKNRSGRSVSIVAADAPADTEIEEAKDPVEEAVAEVVATMLDKLDAEEEEAAQAEWGKLSRITRFYYRLRGRNEKDYLAELNAAADAEASAKETETVEPEEHANDGGEEVQGEAVESTTMEKEAAEVAEEIARLIVNELMADLELQSSNRNGSERRHSSASACKGERSRGALLDGKQAECDEGYEGERCREGQSGNHRSRSDMTGGDPSEKKGERLVMDGDLLDREEEEKAGSTPSWSSASSPEATIDAERERNVGTVLAEMEMSGPQKGWTENGMQYLNKLWKPEPDVIELQEMDRGAE